MTIPFIIVAVLILFVAIGIFGYMVSAYNALIATKNNVQKAFANIDVILKQRHDEIPKLIPTCEGYMTYERATLQKVVDARAAYLGTGNMAQKAQASDQMSAALKSLFAVAENYPDLKANQNFLQLQARVSGLEESLADRREFYNDSVNAYNISIQEFPNVFIANMMGLKPAEMFNVSDADKTEPSMDIRQPS